MALLNLAKASTWRNSGNTLNENPQSSKLQHPEREKGHNKNEKLNKKLWKRDSKDYF